MGLFSLFLLVLTCTGFLMQKLTLNVKSHSASCVSGYRHDIDDYDITGTVGPNFDYFRNLYNLNTFVYFELSSKGDRSFKTHCIAVIAWGDNFCIAPHKNGCCTCLYYDIKTNMAYLKFYCLANVEHSHIRSSWPKNGNPEILSEEIKLPRVYDVEKAVLTMYVNEQLAFTVNELCHISFKAGTTYTLELCCSESAMPCYTRIAFNDTIVTKDDSPCTSYKFTVKNETLRMTAWYSVCDSDKYMVATSCLIKIIGGSTETAKNEAVDHVKIIAILFGFGILVLIAVCVITYSYYKCCRKKASKQKDSVTEQ